MELITTKVVLARDIGVHGNLFGGLMLAWLDEAGAAYACQIADSSRLVTKHISEVNFERPVKTGRIVKIYGKVEHIGNTSVSISLEARRHNPFSGTQKTVCTTKMVFVQIDEEGEPLQLSKKVKDKWNSLI
jgi:acyl-CoA thioesterase YciA